MNFELIGACFMGVFFLALLKTVFTKKKEHKIVSLHPVKFTTTGDVIYYVNDQDFELLKKDPHVIVMEKTR